MASELWRLQVPGQGVGRAVLSLKAPGEAPFLPRPASGSCWKFLVLLGCGSIVPISAFVFTEPPSLCVSVLNFSSLCEDSHPWGRAHPNPLQPHLNLVPAANTLFENKVMFTDPGGT